MEYRSLSTKLPVNELTMFKLFCEKKGVSPASQIRDLILREMRFTVPSNVAGKNKISYNKKTDSFSWNIELDTGEQIDILKSISPQYLENLYEIMKEKLEERKVFTNKKKKDSISVPSDFIRRKND